MGNVKRSPIILGLNAFGHDTSAGLLKDHDIVAACEQERYTLDKHSRLFPKDAIEDCLRIGNISIDDVDEIAFGYDPILYIRKTYLESALKDDARIGFLIKDIERIKENYESERIIREYTAFKGPITFHRHHLCHLAACYYPSGFNEALLASYDGMGEYETNLLGAGDDGEITILDSSNNYPDSLGLIYAAITFYLGWRPFYDEGIIMGLAGYGDPYAIIPNTKKTYYDVFSEIIKETGKYSYTIDKSWIKYHVVRDVWISPRFTDLFGPKREYTDSLTQHHKNIASALQKRVEDIVLGHLSRAQKELGHRKLALSGGVCLNCSMNGKIKASGLFDEIYVQPASGDNGIVVGACFLSYKRFMKELYPVKNNSAYLGSRFSNNQIEDNLKSADLKFEKSGDIFDFTAGRLAEGKIVGWFQGATEFGPRALGNRSILTRPYPKEMKDLLNRRVKFREPFRPFAPAVLEEFTQDYFRLNQKSPHMLLAVEVAQKMRDRIPSVVHVDNSGRVQTVSEKDNHTLYKLIKAFYRRTNCPVILNTSFNIKGMPIVNSPEHAISCFLKTNIDVLVMGDYYVEK